MTIESNGSRELRVAITAPVVVFALSLISSAVAYYFIRHSSLQQVDAEFRARLDAIDTYRAEDRQAMDSLTKAILDLRERFIRFESENRILHERESKR